MRGASESAQFSVGRGRTRRRHTDSRRIMTSQRVLEWTREMAEDEEWDEILSTQVVFDY